MSGFKMTTNLGVDRAFRQAFKTAGEQGFTVTPEGDKGFRAERGNAGLAALLGALNPPCRFDVTIESRDGATEITIERNNPWLTGLLGVRKIKKRAQLLAAGISAALRQDGGQVLKEWAF